MKDNFLIKGVYTISGVILLLVLTQFIPDIRIANYPLRTVNFSKMLNPTFQIVRNRGKMNGRIPQSGQNGPCPKGIFCIEDFGKNDKNYRSLIQAVNAIRGNKGKCRIAFFGDSFTEGDMIIAQLRDTLQQVYGGNGVGFIPFTSPVSRLRPTIEHKHKGWTTFHITENAPSPVPYGITGGVYIPKGEASVTFRVPRLLKWNSLKGYSQIRLFYRTEREGFAEIQTDNRTPERISLKPGGYINSFEINTANFQSVTFQYEDTSGAVFYGMSLEGKEGIYIDNFSLRGNSGPALLKIPSEILSGTDSFQHYSLIVLEFGLNVSGGSTNGLVQYEKAMEKTIEHIQTSFPEAGILIMGVSDRGGKAGSGEIRTLPQITTIRQQQKKLAEKYGLLYWDTWEAMGGENAILSFVEKGWAGKDYTHLSFAGGREIAKMLSNALILEIENRKKQDFTQNMP